MVRFLSSTVGSKRDSVAISIPAAEAVAKKLGFDMSRAGWWQSTRRSGRPREKSMSELWQVGDGVGEAVAGAHMLGPVGALGRCMGRYGGSGALCCVHVYHAHPGPKSKPPKFLHSMS